jgi:hypothetical protein
LSKLKISISGNQYQVYIIKNLIEDLEGIEIIDNCYSWKNIDVFYWIMGFPTFLVKNVSFWLKNKPLIVVHWIGTDVMDLISPKSFIGKIDQLIIRFVGRVKSKKIINLAVSAWLVDELQTVGIQAFYFPISTINTKILKTLDTKIEKEIDFLSYVPSFRFSFYGGNILINLARIFPKYSFAIIMPDIAKNEKLPKSPFSNLVFYPKLSFEQMHVIYQKSKCYIRLTEHDGLSLSVLEALYYELQVIWTYNFPYVNQVTLNDSNGLKATIIRIMEAYTPNCEAKDYVIRNFSEEIWKKKAEKLLEYLQKRSS